MRKSMLVIGVIMALLLSSVNPASAQVKGQDYEFTSMKELESALETFSKDASKSDEEIRMYLYENTDPGVLTAYLESLSKEIGKAMKEMSEEKVNIDTKDVYNKITKTKKVSGGGFVEMEVTDEAVLSDDSSGVISTMGYITKGYGDRRYTAKYNVVHYLYPDTILSLINYLIIQLAQYRSQW
ncbi:hypothetical protein RZN25_18150, partial [Bacillaceae bacterium S4-13-56]